MTTSTTRDKNTRLSPALRLGAVAVWLLLWQLASMAVGLPLLLPSPLAVLLRLGQLCTGADFWLTVASSLLRILLGFLLGVLFGTALAGLCWRFSPQSTPWPARCWGCSNRHRSPRTLDRVFVGENHLACHRHLFHHGAAAYLRQRPRGHRLGRPAASGDGAGFPAFPAAKPSATATCPPFCPSFSRQSAARWALPGNRASPPRCWAVRRGRSAARSTTRKSTWKRPTCLPGRWWSSCCRCCWSALPCALSDGRGNVR